MRTTKRSELAPATVLTTASVLTRPSCAPKIASRISPSRLALRRSSARWAARNSRGNSCGRHRGRASSSSMSSAVRSVMAPMLAERGLPTVGERSADCGASGWSPGRRDDPMNRSTARWTRLAAILAVLLLVLVACGGQADIVPERRAATSQATGRSRGADVDSAVEAARRAAHRAPMTAGQPPLAAPIEQRIVKTGEITLEVEQVGEALGRVRALAVELGGYVGGSQAGTLDDRATPHHAHPAAAFEEALARLHEMDATVVARGDARAGRDRARWSTSRRGSTTCAPRRPRTASSWRAPSGRGHPGRPVPPGRGARPDRAAAGPARRDRGTGRAVDADDHPGPDGDAGRRRRPRPGTRAASSIGRWPRWSASARACSTALIWFAVVWLPVLLILAVIVLVALRGVLEVRRRMPSAASHAAGDDRAA